MFKSTGLTTAPTQKVTWVIGACGGGDRVADGDRVVVSADQDFADDKSQDALLFVEVQLVEAVGETAEEALEGVGEFEVGLGVVQLGVERVELGAECGLALAQAGHPGAQLVDREELFLVGLDQAGDGALGAGDVRVGALRGVCWRGARSAAPGGGGRSPLARAWGLRAAVGPRPRRARRAHQRGSGGCRRRGRRCGGSCQSRCTGSSRSACWWCGLWFGSSRSHTRGRRGSPAARWASWCCAWRSVRSGPGGLGRARTSPR